jgi:hypothetical protein
MVYLLELENEEVILVLLLGRILNGNKYRCLVRFDVDLYDEIYMKNVVKNVMCGMHVLCPMPFNTLLVLFLILLVLDLL